MFQIGIIKTNTFDFDQCSYDEINSDKFSSLIGSYIDTAKITKNTSDDLLSNIIGIITSPADLLTQTCNNIIVNKCLETPTNSVYIYYMPSDETNNNVLASFLSERHEPIVGNAVVINHLIEQTNQFTLREADIDVNRITNIIRKKIIHRGVSILPNNDMTEYEYISNPIENTGFVEKNCKCIQIEFLNKIICVFIEYEPQINTPNKFATLLCKNLRVHGKVLVSIISNYPNVEPQDIDITTLKQVLCVRSHMSADTLKNLSENAIRQNFFYILNALAKKYDGCIDETIPGDVMNTSQTLNAAL